LHDPDRLPERSQPETYANRRIEGNAGIGSVWRMRAVVIGAAVLAASLIGACTPPGAASVSSSPASTADAVSPTQRASSAPSRASSSPPAQPTTASPSASAVVVHPAPPELAGRWQTTDGERITVTFTADRYAISRGPGSARGRLAVRGAQLALSDSDLCVGSGLYTWKVAGSTLTISATATPDPCGNRSDALIDRTFARQ
jgi:hypothetical protein